jgi:hypothetical protein
MTEKDNTTKMIGIWLVDLTRHNTAALWAVGILATLATIVLSRPLQRAPAWRSAVIGLAVMLFCSPVYSLQFDPWWGPAWPSIWVTAQVVFGELWFAAAYFERCFMLPPLVWGILAAVSWYLCSIATANRPVGHPPFI